MVRLFDSKYNLGLQYDINVTIDGGDHSEVQPMVIA
jgi:hypothetical protein